MGLDTENYYLFSAGTSTKDTAREAGSESGFASPAPVGQQTVSTSVKAFFGNPKKLASIVEPGCYYAWIFLVCFTPIMFGDGDADRLAYTTQLLASLAGYLLVLLYRIFGREFRVPIPSAYVILWAICGTLGTTAVMATRVIPVHNDALLPLIAAASAIAGGSFAFIHIYWIAQYARSSAEEAPLVVAGFLLLAFVLCLVGVALPLPAAFVFIALLPLVAGLVTDRTNWVDGTSDASGTLHPLEEETYRLPGGFVFGLVSLGLVYGLAQDFSLTYWHGGEVAVDCLISSGLVGVIVLAYTIRKGKNLGYSAWCLTIVPLAGFAQGMIAIYRTDLLPVSFFFMRMAYALFDAMVWLQLPQAYKKVGSIRVYLMVRLMFEGSMFAGVLLHKALIPFDFAVFNPVALVGLALLISALTFAFASDNVGTVWNLMPATTQYTGKFRRACRSIEEEYGLTKRESEVLELVLRGRSGPYIEEKLFISKNTFQTHMRNVYAKMDIHSQQDLINLLEERLDEHRAREKG